MGAGNYSPSTVARIGDINRGMQVDSEILTGTVSFVTTVPIYVFTVGGRIIIRSLFFEVMSTWAGATLLRFVWKSTIPAVTVQDLSGDCTSLDTFAAGRRVVLVGTLTSTPAVVLPVTPGITTNIMCASMMVGNATSAAGVQQVGQIGCTPTVTSTGGTGKFTLLWVPVDADSYAEALM